MSEEQLHRSIDPTFPVAVDPNDAKTYRYVGVWGFLKPSRTHVLRKAFFGTVLAGLVVLLLPIAAVHGLVAFTGIVPILTLVGIVALGAVFSYVSEILLTNYPGPLAPLRPRIVVRLALLATAITGLLLTYRPAAAWIETMAESELESIAGQQALDELLAGRIRFLDFSKTQASFQHNIAQKAAFRLWACIAVVLVGFTTERIASERKLRIWGKKLEEGTWEDAAGELALTVAHVSDIHLTAPDATLVEGGPSPNPQFERVWSAAAKDLQTVDCILVTGDMTDTGAAEEWRAFMRFAEPVASRMIVVPGNHDVNIIDPNKWYLEGESGFLRSVRLLRMIAALDAIQGERARILVGNDLVLLAKHLDPFRECLAAFATKPHRFLKLYEPSKTRGRFYARKRPPDIAYSVVAMLWSEIFPQAIEHAQAKVVFFALNSNALAGNVLQNALGIVDDAQLGRLKELFIQYRGWSKVILLHHHLALPPFSETRLRAFFSKFMVLINAADVLSPLLEENVVVFHGHRHIEFRGTIGDSVQIVAAPSASLSDEISGASPVIHRFGLYRRGTTGLMAHALSHHSSGLENKDRQAEP